MDSYVFVTANFFCIFALATIAGPTLSLLKREEEKYAVTVMVCCVIGWLAFTVVYFLVGAWRAFLNV
jgi:hypothetical protein